MRTTHVDARKWALAARPGGALWVAGSPRAVWRGARACGAVDRCGQGPVDWSDRTSRRADVAGVRALRSRRPSRACHHGARMKRTFQPNNRRRARKHGFRLRMRTRAGQAIVKARRRKGRARLAA